MLSLVLSQMNILKYFAAENQLHFKRNEEAESAMPPAITQIMKVLYFTRITKKIVP